MHNPPPYEDLSPEEVKKEYDQLVLDWNSFLDFMNVTAKEGYDYFIHKKNLFEVVRRCDKRRAYMAMLNELRNMDEYKRVAIQAFWINTLKPFMVVNEELDIYSSPNELFSLYLILATVRGAYEREFPGKEFVYPNKARISDILYDFKYCNFNREAMIAFVETFADIYDVGISLILNRNASDVMLGK